MATIIINGVTMREAVLYGSTDASDATVYDENINDYVAMLQSRAEEAGLTIEFDRNAQGAASYRVVDEAGFDDLEAANMFMQSAPEFWAWYN